MLFIYSIAKSMWKLTIHFEFLVMNVPVKQPTAELNDLKIFEIFYCYQFWHCFYRRTFNWTPLIVVFSAIFGCYESNPIHTFDTFSLQYFFVCQSYTIYTHMARAHEIGTVYSQLISFTQSPFLLFSAYLSDRPTDWLTDCLSFLFLSWTYWLFVHCLFLFMAFHCNVMCSDRIS